MTQFWNPKDAVLTLSRPAPRPPSVIRVLAFDPGPTSTAWAIVDVGASVVLIDAGHEETDLRTVAHRESHRERMKGVHDLHGVVAVEDVDGYAYSPARVKGLIGTRDVASMLVMLAYSVGFVPMEIPASDVTDHGAEGKRKPAAGKPLVLTSPPTVRRGWRGELCHAPNASNAQIRACVEGLVDMQGKRYPYEEKVHIYDALGLAVVAGHRALGRTLRLPQSVETLLWKAKQKAGERRVKKNAADKIGNSPKVSRSRRARKAARG